jgi:L-lysine exporter family protein LysE/ArgO
MCRLDPSREDRLFSDHELLESASSYAWIDTVLVFGSIIANRPADSRLSLAVGAVLASLTWFLLLTYGARSCRSLFAGAIAWRMLDAFAAAMMLTLAIHLAISRL